MATLVADRFVCGTSRDAIDLATGERVSLRMAQAGSRMEQGEWTRACGDAAATDRGIVDFGLVGPAERFEAHGRGVSSRLSKADRQVVRGAVARSVEWLELSDATSPVFYTRIDARLAREWTLAFAREARLHGFCPVGRGVLEQIVWAGTSTALAPLLAGRSVAVIDHLDIAGGSASLALAVLRLIDAAPRRIKVVVALSRRPAVRPVSRAAEGRATYAPEPVAADPRTRMLMHDAAALTARGRHAAAERAWRAAAGAFERRRDMLHAADCWLELGRLLLSRGRSADAETAFLRSRDKYQERGSAALAATACVCAGVAQTDCGALERAEATLRAAYAATVALQDLVAARTAAAALAHNLRWQRRGGEALALLERAGPDARACDWVLMAQLHVDAGRLTDACRSVTRAREAANRNPDDECAIREVQARIQAGLHDAEALRFHVRHGLRLARAAHLPLRAVMLNLTLIESLLGGDIDSTRAPLIRHLERYARSSVSPLLRQRIRAMIESTRHTDAVRSPKSPTARESSLRFQPDARDDIPELLSLCQSAENERQALEGVARIVQTRVAATGVGVFAAASPAVPTLLGKTGQVTEALARRCLESTQAISPERTSRGTETAVPIAHLGRVIGAIVCRWLVDLPPDIDRALAFVRIAAAACAPLVSIVIERNAPTTSETAPGGIEIVGASAAIEEVRRQVVRAAHAPFAVLIEGESGSGKELVARAIHKRGCRRERALCALNCAALTEDLVDSELFGHARGAFTGALVERLGLFESAEGGTVFLDEVGELSARAQAKLLRVLQEGEVRRVGESFSRTVDARVIAATNRPLAAEVDAGRFRRDLLYRLDVLRIVVPPLRERVEDIPPLVAQFWRTATERMGSRAVLGDAALAALARYDWPGNVRELQNVLSALAVAVPVRGVVAASAMPAAIARMAKASTGETLESARHQFERRFVRAALARSAGHRGQTAAALGLSRQGLSKLMQRLDLA